MGVITYPCYYLPLYIPHANILVLDVMSNNITSHCYRQYGNPCTLVQTPTNQLLDTYQPTRQPALDGSAQFKRRRDRAVKLIAIGQVRNHHRSFLSESTLIADESINSSWQYFLKVRCDTILSSKSTKICGVHWAFLYQFKFWKI